MSDLFGNHIVGFPTRRLIYIYYAIQRTVVLFNVVEKNVMLDCFEV